MSWTEIFAAIRQAAVSTSWQGWAATVTAVVYVILAAKENIFCWPFGVASSALSVLVYYESQLPFEAVLNIGYCALGIYGWWEWRKQKGEGREEGGDIKSEIRSAKSEVRNPAGESEKQTGKPIVNLTMKTGLILLAAGIAGSLLCGWISWHFHTSSLPWSDSAITVFSIIATWMTAKKIIENWLLWVIIDAAAAIIYFIKGPELYLFAMLFILYTFIAVAGYFSWKKIQNRSSV